MFKYATLCVALCAPLFAHATNDPAELPPVVVTANPLGSSLFDLVSPVSVLGGKDLPLRRESTLGETVSQLPGVSSTYFGPNASRPVIRGLDADRIRILQNGIGMLDISALSPDHATTIDPLVVNSIEVVRGPAALLYGGAAVGGVVNLLDNRIPQEAINGFNGRVEARLGGAASERSGAAVLEGGNGRIALHADVYAHETGDLKIPGFARSDRQRAVDDPALVQPHGRLPNSSSISDGGAVQAGFQDFESKGKFRLAEGTGSLDTGELLPRISPLRLGAGLDYQIGNFGARLDVTRAARQDRVAANELPTGGHTLTDAALTWRIKARALNLEATLKGNNLFNQEVRVHASPLRDIAPLPGRGVLVGMRGSF